jgi:hypothetical protein
MAGTKRLVAEHHKSVLDHPRFSVPPLRIRFAIDRAVDWGNRTLLGIADRSMRTANSNRFVTWLGLALWLVCGAFCTIWADDSATNFPATRSLPGSSNVPHSFGGPRLLFSTGVGGIVNMVNAGLDAGVIKAFIEQSRISYHPTAQEIVFLKKLGVANDILLTLLAHSAHPAQNPRSLPPMRPWSEPPLPEQTPAEQPGSPWYGFASPYPIPPYAGSPLFGPYLPGYTAFGPLVSFNNSYPTFVNGQPVYAGYYVPTYRVLW